MASRITELVLDARDPEALASFWCQVLDWMVVDRYDGQVEIGPNAGATAGPTMVFVPSTDERRQKLRLHLDLRPADRDHADELDRLLGLGAACTDVGQEPETRWAVPRTRRATRSACSIR